MIHSKYFPQYVNPPMALKFSPRNLYSKLPDQTNQKIVFKIPGNKSRIF